MNFQRTGQFAHYFSEHYEHMSNPAIAGYHKNSFSKRLLKVFGGLFMELKDDDGDGKWTWVISKGSVMLMAVFIHMMWVWMQGLDIVAGEQSIFYALLAYAGGKVLKDGVTEAIEAAKSPSE